MVVIKAQDDTHITHTLPCPFSRWKVFHYAPQLRSQSSLNNGWDFLLSPDPWTWAMRFGVKSLLYLGNSNFSLDAKTEKQNDPSSLYNEEM